MRHLWRSVVGPVSVQNLRYLNRESFTMSDQVKKYLKWTLIPGAVSIVIGALLILSVRFGWVNEGTDGTLVRWSGNLAAFMTDVTSLKIELFFFFYVMLVSFFGALEIAYRWSKWAVVKCFITAAFFPLAYSVAMTGVPFIKVTSLAIVDAVLCYLFSAIFFFLLPEKPVQTNRRKDDKNPATPINIIKGS